jgi:hypothetical protein
LNVLIMKVKEVVFSVLPITVIVILLNFTLTPLAPPVLIRFLIGAVFIVSGLSIFLFGIELGITPIGSLLGSSIAKTNKISIVLLAGIILGFVISIAEPDLHILAGEVEMVTSGAISKTSLVLIVSVGIAVMMSFGLVRIVYNIPLYLILTGIYSFILLLSLFVSKEFLAISFDASGATTGALTVPFILAIAIGISDLKKDIKASEKDSFGLVAITSTGAIITVLISNLITKSNPFLDEVDFELHLPETTIDVFINEFLLISKESFFALLPILIIFLVSHKLSFHLSINSIRKITMGLLLTYVGLVIYMLGVRAGFMETGNLIGFGIASLPNKVYLPAIGFCLGFVTILAEPAVYVLTKQIEEVTSGYVRQKIITWTLAIGVGAAISLSMLRILIPELQLWHYLLPGYLISVMLMYFTPKLFVGIAFDSGGVASGPMTATFILAFTHGAAQAIDGANVLVDGFGMIAMVALAPLITLQILGIIFKINTRKEV